MLLVERFVGRTAVDQSGRRGWRRRIGNRSVLTTPGPTRMTCLLKRWRRFESCRGHALTWYDSEESLILTPLWLHWATAFRPTSCSTDPTARILGALRLWREAKGAGVTGG